MVSLSNHIGPFDKLRASVALMVSPSNHKLMGEPVLQAALLGIPARRVKGSAQPSGTS